MTGRERHLHEVPAADQVTRWEEIRAVYPEASYTDDGGFFYGSLRDDDIPLPRPDLRRLIDALFAREDES